MFNGENGLLSDYNSYILMSTTQFPQADALERLDTPTVAGGGLITGFRCFSGLCFFTIFLITFI